MNTFWILLLVMFPGGGTTSQQMGFITEVECEAAKKQIKKDIHYTQATCIETPRYINMTGQ